MRGQQHLYVRKGFDLTWIPWQRAPSIDLSFRGRSPKNLFNFEERRARGQEGKRASLLMITKIKQFRSMSITITSLPSCLPDFCSPVIYLTSNINQGKSLVFLPSFENCINPFWVIPIALFVLYLLNFALFEVKV